MAFQSELHSHKVEPDSVPVGLVEAAQPIEHRCPARFRTVKPDWHRATPGLVPDARWAWAGVTKRTGKLLIPLKLGRHDPVTTFPAGWSLG